MINQRQITAIHALKAKLRLSDEDYRSLLSNNFKGATSCKDLSFEDAKTLISSFVKIAANVGVIPTNDAVDDRAGLLTKKQEGMLVALWRKVSFLPAGEQRAALDVFIRKRFGVGCLRWLPRGKVGGVRSTLIAMQTQKKETVDVTNYKQSN